MPILSRVQRSAKWQPDGDSVPAGACRVSARFLSAEDSRQGPPVAGRRGASEEHSGGGGQVQRFEQLPEVTAACGQPVGNFLKHVSKREGWQ
jgi:hypothetical protein